MPITGYMRIPDIQGESKASRHEDAIEIHGIEWGIAQKSKAARPGSGRRQARAIASPLEIHKFYDASSPYITLAALQGKSFDEITLSVRKDSGDAHLDYLVVTMTNCAICAYGMFNDGADDPSTAIGERVGITFEKVKVLYTVQADDHSSGDEHEIEFDLAAGV